MIESVELGLSLGKREFKDREPQFREQLLALQRQLRDVNIATPTIVAGVETAGKGDVVNRLNKWPDNRGVQTHAFWDETDEEKGRPDNWRFWKRMPVRRFKEREELSWKQYKITDDDRRNREKENDYKQAVKMMVEHTSTGLVPWSLLSADDKLFTRVEVLKTVCEQLSRSLQD